MREKVNSDVVIEVQRDPRTSKGRVCGLSSWNAARRRGTALARQWQAESGENKSGADRGHLPGRGNWTEYFLVG